MATIFLMKSLSSRRRIVCNIFQVVEAQSIYSSVKSNHTPYQARHTPYPLFLTIYCIVVHELYTPGANLYIRITITNIIPMRTKN